jgi:hypothetical protein
MIVKTENNAEATEKKIAEGKKVGDELDEPVHE